jgi:hypothetical protein
LREICAKPILKEKKQLNNNRLITVLTQHLFEDDWLLDNLKAPPKDVSCLFCNLILPTARKLIRENETKHWISIATFFCTELKIEDYDVCNQVSRFYWVK